MSRDGTVENTWVLKGENLASDLPILSFSHGLWTPSTPGAAPEVQDVSLVLRAGTALPFFVSACMNRRSLGRVVLEVREAQGMKMTYEMLNTRVASIRPGGNAASNERPLYELALCFDELKVKVDEPTGSAEALVTHDAA